MFTGGVTGAAGDIAPPGCLFALIAKETRNQKLKVRRVEFISPVLGLSVTYFNKKTPVGYAFCL